MAANEDFNALKAAVLKAETSELSGQLGRAALAWEFLLGFAAKKPFYRSHLCQVIEALLAQPGWRDVYARSQELQEMAETVHEDVKKALAAVPAAPAPAPKQEERPKSGPSKDVEWPSWEVLEEVVKKETFMAANEEFRVLRLAVIAADEVQLASQVAHAAMAWEFIAGFAAKKPHFRSQVVEVVSALRKESGWEAALEAAQPSLRSRLAELPEAVRGPLSRADKSPSALSGGDSSMDEIGQEQEHQMPYTSPDFQSLEERLRSMQSCVANLAPDEPPAVGDVKSTPPTLPEEPEPDAREELVSQLLDSAKPPEAKPQGDAVPAEDAVPDEASCILDMAASLEAAQPVVAHYLRIHALEMLLAAKQSGQSRTAEADKLLLTTFEKAEQTKASLDLTGGAEQLRHFAVQNYEQAISADGGVATADLAQNLLTAGLCLGALAQFGQMEPALAERAAYAKSRAGHLRECLRHQLPPAAPQPPVQPPAAPAAPAPPPPRTPAADPPRAPNPPPSADLRPADPKPEAPPSRPAVVPVQQAPPAVPAVPAVPAAATLPPSKRQAEARKKADQAIAAVAAGSDDSARALIKEALGLLHGL
ncbi:LIP5 [Symbiodinium natans]|uniref:LIP5 protein n=1 Tax=Symbiodinium natans TaxID=878477 RepID=A0A812RIN2_9DINO|nr:LIP5 [Symbiodinium natans]